MELVTATDMDDRDEDEDDDSDPPPAVTLSDALVAALATSREQDFLSFKDETRAVRSLHSKLQHISVVRAQQRRIDLYCNHMSLRVLSAD